MFIKHNDIYSTNHRRCLNFEKSVEIFKTNIKKRKHIQNSNHNDNIVSNMLYSST